MRTLWGLVVIVLGVLAWGGQTASWLAPRRAARLGLTERQEDVETTYWADIRGEAVWDALTLWTAIVAGVLLIADSAAWPAFGLVAGGMYVYFGGRGISTRLAMRRRGLRIGRPSDVTMAIVFLTIWLIMGLVTIVAAGAAVG